MQEHLGELPRIPKSGSERGGYLRKPEPSNIIESIESAENVRKCRTRTEKD